MLEAQQKRAVEIGTLVHFQSPPSSGFAGLAGNFVAAPDGRRHAYNVGSRLGQSRECCPDHEPSVSTVHEHTATTLDFVFKQTYFIHMNVRQVPSALKADGWVEVRSKGSHRQLKHPVKPSLVTLPMHGTKDLKPGTLASIERQAGLKFRSK
jgi:predicted RNA binding protein YcfA (HicA-like mRNA interferase family)